MKARISTLILTVVLFAIAACSSLQRKSNTVQCLGSQKMCIEGFDCIYDVENQCELCHCEEFGADPLDHIDPSK